ncbi:hypothetical protein NP493_2374g00000 [Ridgeia piscesae]|uniref:Uncharacterized protein n=1 Tax=Ridgeia piscesae TaxID=27915 RepID=A0AAD9JIE9_RIDPI|nr:hypothetical protein NP493_2374g00000 [Ridgeia piscesae]
MYYRSCGLNQSHYPGLGRCGCQETYCERYSGWQATVCNGCGSYVYCRYGRSIRYRRCLWNIRHYDLSSPSLCQQVQQLLWPATIK